MFSINKNSLAGKNIPYKYRFNLKLDKKQLESLTVLSHASAKLFNAALKNYISFYKKERKVLRAEVNFKLLGNTEEAKLLYGPSTQYLLKFVGRYFRQHFISQNTKHTDYRFHIVDPVRFFPEDGFGSIIYPPMGVKVRIDDLTQHKEIFLPMSNSFKKKYPNLISELKIPCWDQLLITLTPPKFTSDIKMQTALGKMFKDVRLIPERVYSQDDIEFKREKLLGFSAEFVIDAPASLSKNFREKTIKPNKSNVLSIYINEKTICSCIDNLANTQDIGFNFDFSQDAEKLNSKIKHLKEKRDRLVKFLNLQGYKTSKRICRIDEKINSITRDRFYKVAKHIADYCISAKIGIVIVSCLDPLGNELLEMIENENNDALPLGRLRTRIYDLLDQLGINYIEQDDLFIKEASFYDEDCPEKYESTLMGYLLPNHPVPKERKIQKPPSFSGKADQKRSIMISKEGLKYDLYINAAANLLRRASSPVFDPWLDSRNAKKQKIFDFMHQIKNDIPLLKEKVLIKPVSIHKD